MASRLTEPLDAALGRVSGRWAHVVAEWRATPEAEQLVAHVDRRVEEGAVVYPAHVLRALELTPLEKTRVVVLGQDPYHGPGQAEGLAFSVETGVRFPPSLRNIFKELERDLGVGWPVSGHLGPWARQGVLLLNTTLTVEEGLAASHAKRGWESLTDRLIGAAAEAAHESPKVFMLWGAHAQAKEGLIRDRVAAHGAAALVLKANHPSPLSAMRAPVPFIGCGHFSLANAFLASVSGPDAVIDWQLR